MTDETPTPETAAPAAPPADRGYTVLHRTIRQPDGTERKVTEKFNQARRDLKQFITQWEARTGKKCTPRQIKKLRKQAREQEALQAAILRSAAEQSEKLEDMGLLPPTPTAGENA